ncbi:P-loop containing nucleoside triphosphate hydrolase protein [Hypoxylon trugodes]|uniref:P-loop containing nucleoside triphosphate hydrolase protein n=1 Tax=Hypoxylon trugodes TaxID=326681 RepID=UPI00219802C2|nr:P-loop containing nucleoside triphosphate hydrolase protein [Hypoxylon trugodes]KAI1386268.1 P-loop containing nucleoside triphosphate hydrolase protein [Hypoxylon trugodes]
MPPLFTRWLRSARLIPRLLIAGHRRKSFSTSVVSYVANLANPFQGIRLRDYQEECIQSVLSSLKYGHKRLGISLATGSGKTVIFTQLIDRIKSNSDEARQTLILAHRRELVEQAARHCTTAYPNKSVEIEMGNMHSSGTADITIASIQSINSGDRLDKFNPRWFKLILVDEAHHIVAPGYLNVLEHFGLDKKRDDSPALVGVSATFSRTDGLRLGAAIDEIVYHKDYVDMIGDRWLSDVIFTTVESTADISKVKSGNNGDFQPGDLSRAVNTKQVNEITVRSWLAKASERKSTLVFCVDLAHVSGLTDTFRQHGIDARFVMGETPKVERSERIDAFRRQEFPVLINCGVFTEGTDIPNIDCIILARPTRSRNLLVQMIGRGMRLHPDKEDCHIIDMVSSLSTGIVTTPTLFGLDPSEVVKEASVDEMRRLKTTKQEGGPGTTGDGGGEHKKAHNITFVEYDSVFDLIADTSGDKHIRSISQNAWVQVGPSKWILSGPHGTYIRLEKEDTTDDNEKKFAAWEIRALPSGVSKSPYAAPRRLLKATSFIDAVHGCDKYASEKYPRPLISRYQRWRSGPPTNGQLNFLNKLRGEKEKLKVTDITKGKATDMITKLRHGARGRFTSIDADRRRKEQQQNSAQEREQAMQLREKVTVGPLSV